MFLGIFGVPTVCEETIAPCDEDAHLTMSAIVCSVCAEVFLVQHWTCCMCIWLHCGQRKITFNLIWMLPPPNLWLIAYGNDEVVLIKDFCYLFFLWWLAVTKIHFFFFNYTFKILFNNSYLKNVYIYCSS